MRQEKRRKQTHSFVCTIQLWSGLTVVPPSPKGGFISGVCWSAFSASSTVGNHVPYNVNTGSSFAIVERMCGTVDDLLKVKMLLAVIRLCFLDIFTWRNPRVWEGGGSSHIRGGSSHTTLYRETSTGQPPTNCTCPVIAGVAGPELREITWNAWGMLLSLWRIQPATGPMQWTHQHHQHPSTLPRVHYM